MKSVLVYPANSVFKVPFFFNIHILTIQNSSAVINSRKQLRSIPTHLKVVTHENGRKPKTFNVLLQSLHYTVGLMTLQPL